MSSQLKARILGVSNAFPPHRIQQETISHALKKAWLGTKETHSAIDKLHAATSVKHRHISMPVEALLSTENFTIRNNAFIKTSLELADNCVSDLLQQTKTNPRSISQIISTTVTGICVPSIDARLMNRIDFSPHIKRVPLFGLGCVAGAAGLSRAADYLKGHPDELVLLLAVELCSLTFQKSDRSIANIISCGLFGDGACAVLLGGARRDSVNESLPAIIDNRSFFFPDTESVMGWDISQDGFKIVLNAQVPTLAYKEIPRCVDNLLATHHIHRSDISHWIAHPGGPKVIEALHKGLQIPSKKLIESTKVLAEIGNLSSATVLLILKNTLKHADIKPGDLGVLIAMGPGFCAEVVLIKW